MCGICGIASGRGGVDRDAARGDVGDPASTAAPTPRASFVDGGVGLAARRLAIIDLSGGDQPISQRGRNLHGRPERRDLQLRRAQRTLERAGHRLAHTLATPRRSCTPTRSGGSASPSGCAACSRSRSGTRRRRRLVLARDRFGIKPLYYRDARRRARRSPPSSTRCRSGELDLDALEAFLATNVVPGPLSIFREIRKLPPGHLLTWEADGGIALERFARPGPLPPRREPTRPSWSRSAAPGSPTRCAPTSSRTCPSACCSRAASTLVRSPRSRPRESSEPLRTFSIGFEEQSFDELDGRARGRRALRHAPPRARPAPRRGRACCRRSPRPSTSRSPTPRRSPPTSSRSSPRRGRQGRRSRARAATSSSAATTPTSPTCCAERFGPLARRAAAGDRAPALARRGGSSLDYRAKRFARAAHLPPLERHHGWKEIFSAEARAELTGRRQRLRPARARARPASPRPRGTSCSAGCRTSTSAATSSTTCSSRPTAPRWPGRSRRASRSSTPPSPTSRSRCRRGSRCAGFDEEAAAARALEPLLPREVVHGRKRGFSIPAAAWLRGELERVRARDARRRDAAPAGLPPPRGRSPACSTSTSRGAPTSPASSGACSCSRSGTSATSRASRRDVDLGGLVASAR